MKRVGIKRGDQMKQRRRQNSSPNHRRLLASVALVADVQNPLKRSSYEADTLSCATKNICFLILWKYPSDLVSSPTINDKDYRFTFTPKIEPRSNQDNLRSRFTFGAPSIVILESVLPLGWRSFWYLRLLFCRARAPPDSITFFYVL